MLLSGHYNPPNLFDLLPLIGSVAGKSCETYWRENSKHFFLGTLQSLIDGACALYVTASAATPIVDKFAHPFAAHILFNFKLGRSPADISFLQQMARLATTLKVMASAS